MNSSFPNPPDFPDSLAASFETTKPGGVRLDCVGSDVDQTFPPDALQTPYSLLPGHEATHQVALEQVRRAAEAGGLVQVWYPTPAGSTELTPGAWVRLFPVDPGQVGLDVLTAKVDACLLWSAGGQAFDSWTYQGPTVPAVGADSGLEPPHTGAWVLLEADELAETNHLAVWYPNLERAEWALNQSAYIDAVAADTSENWVEISAVESLSVRADTLTEGHFEFETEADEFVVSECVGEGIIQAANHLEITHPGQMSDFRGPGWLTQPWQLIEQIPVVNLSQTSADESPSLLANPLRYEHTQFQQFGGPGM